MPTNKNAVIRYRYLDELLSDTHHYYDIHDLTEKVNDHLRDDKKPTVTERCIQKDLQALEYDPYYVDLDRTPVNGKNCIRYADPCFTIFSKKMTEDEENLLSEVLSTLGQFQGLANLEWLEDIKSRLGVKERPKVIEFSSNPDLRNSDMLAQLFTVTASKTPIRISYRPFTAVMRPKPVVVHPYLLKQYNNRWFLFCGCDTDGFVINYAIDRIESFEPLPAHPFLECKEDLQERFDSIVGVTLKKGAKEEHVVLWASDDQLPYIETKPIYPYQHIVPKSQESAYREKYPSLKSGRFITMDIIPNWELLQSIVPYFEGIVLLEPLHLRKEFTYHISEMNKKMAMI